MRAQEYYHRVIDRLRNCYQFGHYLVASGKELTEESDSPFFPSVAAPLEELERWTLQRGLPVHLPVVGKQSCSVLMPLDIEVFLDSENHRLYTDKESQRRLFEQVVPIMDFVENLLRSRGIPYLLDYTPSGCHFLFQNVLGYRATEELKGLGFVEEDLARACSYRDPHDIRRWYGVSEDAALVFSGLGKLAEYLALLTMEEFRDNESRGLLPVTISDSADYCINFDNTWNEGSPFMRVIRSPFSLHRKNQEKHGKFHQPPLVDVVGTYFDGSRAREVIDLDHVFDCMWDLEKAAGHAEDFSGHIPCSNESLIDLVDEYRASDLHLFHRDFEHQEEIPRGQAVGNARREAHISDDTRQILDRPNPSALQPKRLIGFVHDFLVHANWKPRNIANVLRDLYQDPSHGWSQDFWRYPADEKANFWARTYSAVALWRTGRLRV